MADQAADEYPPDEPVRSVRVRQPKHTHKPIMAIDSQRVLTEDGQVFALSSLPYILSASPSSIIVCQGFGDALALLIDTYGDRADFQYRATPRGENLLSDHTSSDTLVNFVGFKALNKHEAARYHYPLDPIHFCRSGIDDIYPPTRRQAAAKAVADTAQAMGEGYLLALNPDSDHIIRLMLWGQEVRKWCEKQQLEIKPSAGGLSSQLLRDPRFYAEPRRKVPRIINDLARRALPGNHYKLYGDPSRVIGYRAIYLDMEAAHHHAAARIAFPDANTLHAYGNWNDERARPFASGESPLLGDPAAGRARHQGAYPGLYHLRVTVPPINLDRFPPPYLEQAGERNLWLFTNELDSLSEFGVRVEAVLAALVSDAPETGLNHYARFALDELRTTPPTEKPWLKPTLHSAYGLLAARSIQFETGFHQSLGGTEREYLIGRHSLKVKATRAKAATESKIVNVIHRGMIEAQVRREVLETCRLLAEADGRQILAIYADSLLVRDNGDPLRLLTAPWRVKETLTDLQFIDSTHFTSNEMNRLPGFPRSRDEARRVDDYRRLMVRQRDLARPIRLANRERTL